MVTYGVKLQRSTPLHLSPRQDTCTEAAFAEWCREQSAGGARLAVDLFSGAGGLSLGLTLAGWTLAAAVDHDSWALKTHRANFPGLTLDLDLGERTGRDRLVRLLSTAPIDLVAGGPPCQPFSRAGRSKIRSLVRAGAREAVDHRRELWRGFLEVVLRVEPRAVIMENVPDMALGDDLYVVRCIVEALETAGYRTQVTLANAWQYGVPQHRQRMILLARRDDTAFVWPAAAPTQVHVKHAIGDLPSLGRDTGARRLEYVGRPDSEFARMMRRGAEPGVVYDHMTRPVRDDDRAVFAMMDSKTLYANLPQEYRRYSAETFDDKYKRLGWEELSRSITAHIARDGYWYIHPGENRTLTVREAARIQTFPDWFRFAGTRSDAFRQIGNAVPPLLGEAAARAVLPRPRDTGGDGRAVTNDPRDWRAIRHTLGSWAKRQRRGRYWYLLPGSGTTPAVAALVAMLRGAPNAWEAVAHLRGTTALPVSKLTAVRDASPSRTVRAAVERLLPLARRRKIWNEPDQLAEACAFRPAESELFHLLSGTDLLLTSQAAVRVAARFCGTDSHDRNRRSNGRLDLARLVGAGDNAPLRMAAICLIGATMCRPKEPDCPRCPLRPWCAAEASSPAELTANHPAS